MTHGDIMAITNNKNFLQPSGFRVIIDKDNYANLEFFAQSVQHPGASVDALDFPIPKVNAIPLTGSKITYSELSINLIVDEDMTAYKEMQGWLERTVLESDNSTLYNDITLIILSSHNNENTRIRYKNCVPTQVSGIEFTSTTGDTSFITFDATFRFSDFEIL